MPGAWSPLSPMKLLRLLPLCLVLAARADIPALPSEAPADAVILWNGRDLTGWTVFLKDATVDPKTIWSASDGVLSLVGQPYGYLRTKQAFGSYHLHVEWRYPADAPANANSGVFIHVHDQDAIWPSGMECQLRAGEAGLLIDTNVDMPSAPLINKKKRAKATGPAAEKPFGQWNSYDIFCRGATVEIYVNGVLENHVENITYASGSTDLSGSIALQQEGAHIQFRHVWLQPLQKL
jgi:hypothetical protein